MSRIVELKPKKVVTAKTAEFASGGGKGVQEKINEYGERVAKYIPAEILAFYTGVVQLILIKGDVANANLRMWLFAIFGLIAWICTPFYIARFTKISKERLANQCMATAAFGIWLYAYPAGWFVEMGWHDPLIAGLLLICFTFASGFFQPKE